MYSTQRGADQADFFCGCCRRCRRCVLGLETVAQPSSLLLLIVRPLWLQTSSLLWLSRRAVKRNGKQKRERFIENKRAWARARPWWRCRRQRTAEIKKIFTKNI